MLLLLSVLILELPIALSVISTYLFVSTFILVLSRMMVLLMLTGAILIATISASSWSFALGSANLVTILLSISLVTFLIISTSAVFAGFAYLLVSFALVLSSIVLGDVLFLISVNFFFIILIGFSAYVVISTVAISGILQTIILNFVVKPVFLFLILHLDFKIHSSLFASCVICAVVLAASSGYCPRISLFLAAALISPALGIFVSQDFPLDFLVLGLFGYIGITTFSIFSIAIGAIGFATLAVIAVLSAGLPIIFINIIKFMFVVFSEFCDIALVIGQYALILPIFLVLFKSSMKFSKSDVG